MSVKCEFRYGGEVLHISVPSVPRKDETIIMPSGVLYRVIGVRWYFDYEEVRNADAAGQHIDRHKPSPTWQLIDQAINAIVFLEK